MNETILALALQAGITISKVAVRDSHGKRVLYFLKRDGKLLFNGDSFEFHELRPALERGGNLQESTSGNC